MQSSPQEKFKVERVGVVWAKFVTTSITTSKKYGYDHYAERAWGEHCIGMKCKTLSASALNNLLHVQVCNQLIYATAANSQACVCLGDCSNYVSLLQHYSKHACGFRSPRIAKTIQAMASRGIELQDNIFKDVSFKLLYVLFVDTQCKSK